MKISQFVLNLQKIQEEFGDLEVVIADDQRLTEEGVIEGREGFLCVDHEGKQVFVLEFEMAEALSADCAASSGAGT